ncbi:M10 family metallopeptidase C-terminal domain-containing protein [Palleronia pelagia]|uniref:Ca2+-binding protein, RTX toxin-related n=1 Tax=Palleronia pelagia TaxID=387096 RepID=A0A1H8JY19_9RHOB|nr:hypothetical protein [Palleronia pelagia]SEN85405.1 Ca2+-binding protein, RTX toxin-related [Palleronia pelagia]
MSTLNLTSQWIGGFRSDYELTNSSNVPGAVSIDVRFIGEVEKFWGAGTLERLSQDTYRIAAADVAPGESVAGGFIATSQDAAIAIADQSVPAPQTDFDLQVGPQITASELQGMIDTVATGTRIELQAGTYHFDRTIILSRENIALEGVGSEAVTIRMADGCSQEAFRVDGGDRTDAFKLSQAVAQGATELAISGEHSFEAGDFVYLERANTDDFFAEIGDTAWRESVPLRTSIVEVAEVRGQTLVLTSGVHFEFDTVETTVQEIDLLEDVSLGGFTIDYGLDVPDPSDFSNTMPQHERVAAVELHGTSGARLHDVVARNVPSLGFNTGLSRELVTDGTFVSAAHNKGKGGNGYALQIRDVYDSRFLNHGDQDMRHSITFASWRSAAGNEVHVLQTDRDINFHGGRDHNNSVLVERSLRDADSDVIESSSFVNLEGASYGAPTAEGVNSIRFGTLVGTRLADDVTAFETGGDLDGRGGDDILRGGAGNDTLRGGEGDDLMIGAGGDDVARYDAVYENFRLEARLDGRISIRDITGTLGNDIVEGVETLIFSNATVMVDGIGFHVSTEGGASGDSGSDGPVLLGTAGKDQFTITESNTTVYAGADWDSATSTVSFTMTAELEKLELIGDASIDAIGSNDADLILSNDAANSIYGNGGDDRIFGRGGSDAIFGGSGDDGIDGGPGADRIHGGGGSDRLSGQGGDDVFQYNRVEESGAWGVDSVTDFETGDLFDLSRIDADITRDGNQAFTWQGAGAGRLWVAAGTIYGDVDGDGTADLVIEAGQYAFSPADFLL